MNGYITDRRGCTHWGLHGAAGLLLRHADETGVRYLMQQRSPWVQHGGTWSVPGGALLEHETAEDGALREALEELGCLPRIRHVHTLSDDHGGWTYHTVFADTDDRFTARRGDGEAAAHAWTPAKQVQQLPLHPGFAAAWPRILLLEGAEA